VARSVFGMGCWVTRGVMMMSMRERTRAGRGRGEEEETQRRRKPRRPSHLYTAFMLSCPPAVNLRGQFRLVASIASLFLYSLQLML
jgi:hypothetical protein